MKELENIAVGDTVAVEVAVFGRPNKICNFKVIKVTKFHFIVDMVVCQRKFRKSTGMTIDSLRYTLTPRVLKIISHNYGK
jgi:hypothetical protein